MSHCLDTNICLLIFCCNLFWQNYFKKIDNLGWTFWKYNYTVEIMTAHIVFINKKMICKLSSVVIVTEMQTFCKTRKIIGRSISIITNLHIFVKLLTRPGYQQTFVPGNVRAFTKTSQCHEQKISNIWRRLGADIKCPCPKPWRAPKTLGS